MKDNLFIPSHIKCGFQKRKDTYTEQLCFITYCDQKGSLKKEKSWNQWRDQSIEPKDFKNEPTSGFVLNKSVGGNNYFSNRQSYIRVYDPRNFEIEITLENLLFILQETNCQKGSRLDGEFVYAWYGQQLHLIPVNCKEYLKSKTFTSKQKLSIAKNDVIPGNKYLLKNGKSVIYLGKLKFNDCKRDIYIRYHSEEEADGLNPYLSSALNYKGESHVFVQLETRDDERTILGYELGSYSLTNNYIHHPRFFIMNKFDKIAEKDFCSEEEYSFWMDKFLKSNYNGEFDILVKKKENKDFDFSLNGNLIKINNKFYKSLIKNTLNFTSRYKIKILNKEVDVKNSNILSFKESDFKNVKEIDYNKNMELYFPTAIAKNGNTLKILGYDNAESIKVKIVNYSNE